MFKRVICIGSLSVAMLCYHFFYSDKIHIPRKWIDVPLHVIGRVSSIPIHFQCLYRFNLDLLTVDGERESGELPSKLPMTLFDCSKQLKVNQTVAATLRIKQSGSESGPRYYGTVLSKCPIAISNGHGGSIEVVRQFLYFKIQSLIQDRDLSAIVSALSLGIKDYYFHQIKPVFTATGTSHLFAISGLHVGLVLFFSIIGCRMLLSMPMCFLGLECLITPVTLALALCIVLLFCCLSGLSAPTIRAGIMISAVLVLIIMKRSTDVMNMLLITCLFFIVINSASIISVSACLSFSAVLLLIGFRDQFGVQQHAIKSLLLLQWVLFIGLLPITLLFFSQWVLVAPLINIIVVPFVSIVIIPLCMAVVCFPHCVAEMIAHWILIPLTGGLFSTLSYLSAIKWFSIYAGISNYQFTLIVLIMPLLLLPLGRVSKGIGLLLLMLVLSINHRSPKFGTARLTMINVGQGLSLLIKTQHHSLLYDVGRSFYSGSDMVQKKVFPFLRKQSINQIDALVISHGDDDHIGGYQSLMNQYSIDNIYSSALGRLPRSLSCLAGHSWEWDGVRFEFLYPDPFFMGLTNNSSCVMKVTSAHQSALFTGDIEGLAESYLLHFKLDQLKSDILQVPHHGSNTSSSKAFIEAVDPMLAWVSAGKDNHYGMPAAEVLHRYQSLGVSIKSTIKEDNLFYWLS